MIGEVAGDLTLPYLMAYIVNYGILGNPVTDPETGSAAAAAIMRLFSVDYADRLGIVILFGVLMLAVTVVGGFFGTFCAWTAASASQGFGNDLRRTAYAKVMSLSIEQTDRFTTGSLVTRMTNDITQLVNYVESVLRMFVRSPMFFIGGTVMLLSLHLSFGAVLLAALPVLALTLILVLVKAIPLFSKVQDKLDRVNAVMQESIAGTRVIKAYSREEYECERFDKANKDLKKTSLGVYLLMAWMSPVMTAVMWLATGAILLIGGNIVRLGDTGMTVGSIMAGTSYISRVLSSVIMMTMMFQSVSRASVSAKRINELLESDPVIAGGTAAEGAGTDVPAVEFRNVGFSYPNTSGRNVLSGISLTVKKGEKLAVIGATGSGKTTLVSLIPRFYDATEGEVLVDGVPVGEYDLAALRSKIGYVMQKTDLFSDTVSNNIKWGREDATDEEVAQAAETAQAAEFIATVPGGYDGLLAEKGASLSGGQKQRLSIARALVRRPEILILDDSTSALDLATEGKLLRALRRDFADTTVVMIAQRIASVKSADRIAVIESDGSVKHIAPHDELMKISETYREIYSSQVKSGSLGE
ncbi:MAG: ABC transporter ATP-binding protein [Clostridia bacterium]|nr:ABC transporter ATP-binding protein [Clostridia bacterium]MBP5269932.1 ABC transporter ATP-binding protein [Clostridia bacterium]